LANKILELALNRTSKSVNNNQASNNIVESMRPAPFTTTQSPVVVVNKIMDRQKDINLMDTIIQQNQNGNAQMKLSPEDVERTKAMLQKDIQQYNSDLKLLSLLIGRPLGPQDIAKLAATNLGKPAIKTAATTPATTTTTTSAIPKFANLSDEESKFLLALQQIQTTRKATTSTTSTTTTTTTTTTQRPTTRTRSQEAIIAALLKEQGIGPGVGNQIEIEVSNLK
jgi:hypothetical protein